MWARRGASYEKAFSRDLSYVRRRARTVLRVQPFRSARFRQSQTPRSALSYTARQLDDIIFSGQLGYTRLTHRGLFDNAFYRNGNLELGAQKIITINRAQLVSFGGDIDLGLFAAARGRA